MNKQSPDSTFALARLVPPEPKAPAVVQRVSPATLALQNSVRDFVEIEVYGRRNEPLPSATMYIIRIDGERHTLDAAGLTGRQLLALAGKLPVERFAIFLRLCGGQTQVLPHDCLIDFNTPGLERLVTLPLDQTEGGK